jgi:hypothetical protein
LAKTHFIIELGAMFASELQVLSTAAISDMVT